MIFKDLKPGKSVFDKDIPAYISDGVKSKKYIYLIAGTHGDEVEGVYVLKQLFEWIKEDTELKDLPLVIVPILNIDGHESSTRVNAKAVDLNRNLPTENWIAEFKKEKYNPGPEAGSEPENQFLLKLLKKYPPGFVLSFHSWKPMINYNGDCSELANRLGLDTSYEVTDDIGYPTPGSLGTYIPEAFSAPIITYECPVLNSEKSLKDIWEEGETGLKNLFNDQLFDQFLS